MVRGKVLQKECNTFTKGREVRVLGYKANNVLKKVGNNIKFKSISLLIIAGHIENGTEKNGVTS